MVLADFEVYWMGLAAILGGLVLYVVVSQVRNARASRSLGARGGFSPKFTPADFPTTFPPRRRPTGFAT